MVIHREKSNHHLNWSDIISCYNITIVSFCNNLPYEIIIIMYSIIK